MSAAEVPTTECGVSTPYQAPQPGITEPGRSAHIVSGLKSAGNLSTRERHQSATNPDTLLKSQSTKSHCSHVGWAVLAEGG